jgi:ketosteroid isomerase-like protein
MQTTKYSELKNLDSFFDVIYAGLDQLVDGEHFFDFLADDVTFEFRYRFPGLPEKVSGRDELIKLFAGVAGAEILHSNGGLVVHQSVDPTVVILEYEVHGTSLVSGKPYDNRFASIITIKNRKVVYWRDYMDSLAARNAHSVEH